MSIAIIDVNDWFNLSFVNFGWGVVLGFIFLLEPFNCSGGNFSLGSPLIRVHRVSGRCQS
jgi:hypothetical protein